MNENFENKIGYTFRDKNLLKLALTHSSYKNEDDQKIGDNERLEFLGDSVLSLIVTRYLYENFKDKKEGDLTKMRASLVYNKALTEFAKKIDLGSELYMGKGEEKLGGRRRPSNLENAFEALVGAIFIDGGLNETTRFLNKFIKAIKNIEADNLKDYKSKFMETLQKSGNYNIDYEIVNQYGPAHDRTFDIELKVNGKLIGLGKGKSRKKAEQSAAKKALNNWMDKYENKKT